MQQMTKVAIDLDVHIAIETRRTDLNQSQNAILRDILNLPTRRTAAPAHAPRGRRTGSWTFTLLGEDFTEDSLKEAYRVCLCKIAERDSGFLERLAQVPSKSRRIIARNPEDIYRANPRLAAKYAQRLDGTWWYDSNLSRLQMAQRLRTACTVAGLTFGGADGDLIAPFLP